MGQRAARVAGVQSQHYDFDGPNFFGREIEAYMWAVVTFGPVTIAACYLLPEGVILGADSTTTVELNSGLVRHFEFGQKVFEVGERSTLGLCTWGLATLTVSFRALVAEFSDQLAAKPPSTVQDAANAWQTHFSAAFHRDLATEIARLAHLRGLATRTRDEDNEMKRLGGAGVGFCIGGRAPGSRAPGAYSVLFTLDAPGGTQQAIPMNAAMFWGAPHILNRVQFGIDLDLFDTIAQHPKWTGTVAELRALVQPHVMGWAAHLPIREAIDYVHASIYTTIKALKFSPSSPVCGGPIELAVITNDRPFRWVGHKRLAEAIAVHDVLDI